MHLVQIYTFLGCPEIKIRIFCRLALNLRFVQRAIFEPVPPLALYWPLRATAFPEI